MIAIREDEHPLFERLGLDCVVVTLDDGEVKVFNIEALEEVTAWLSRFGIEGYFRSFCAERNLAPTNHDFFERLLREPVDEGSLRSGLVFRQCHEDLGCPDYPHGFIWLGQARGEEPVHSLIHGLSQVMDLISEGHCSVDQGIRLIQSMHAIGVPEGLDPFLAYARQIPPELIRQAQEEEAARQLGMFLGMVQASPLFQDDDWDDD